MKAGDTVQVGAILGAIAEGKTGTPSAVAASNPDSAAPKAAPAPKPAAAPQAGLLQRPHRDRTHL